MAYYASPWLSWTTEVTTGSAVSYQVNTQIWSGWNTTNVTTSASLQVWDAWAGQYPLTTSAPTWGYWNADPQIIYPPNRSPTEEQLERQRVLMEETRRASAERQAKIVTAKARAKALLLDHLDPVQKRDYEEKGSFRVEVGSRTFQINPGTHGNVKELHLEDGREIVIRSFCIPSRRSDVPEPDVHLAQKLMLEGGEDSFRDFHRIANITNYRPDLALQVG